MSQKRDFGPLTMGPIPRSRRPARTGQSTSVPVHSSRELVVHGRPIPVAVYLDTDHKTTNGCSIVPGSSGNPPRDADSDSGGIAKTSECYLIPASTGHPLAHGPATPRATGALMALSRPCLEGCCCVFCLFPVGWCGDASSCCDAAFPPGLTS